MNQKKLSLEDTIYFKEFETLGKKQNIPQKYKPILLQMRTLAKDALNQEYTDIPKAKEILNNFYNKLFIHKQKNIIKTNYQLN